MAVEIFGIEEVLSLVVRPQHLETNPEQSTPKAQLSEPSPLVEVVTSPADFPFVSPVVKDASVENPPQQ